MSIWKDIREKSLGQKKRKEVFVPGVCKITKVSDRKACTEYMKQEIEFGDFSSYTVSWKIMDKYVDKENRFSGGGPDPTTFVLIFDDSHAHDKKMVREVFRAILGCVEKKFGEWEGATLPDGGPNFDIIHRILLIMKMMHAWNMLVLNSKGNKIEDEKMKLDEEEERIFMDGMSECIKKYIIV